MSNCKNSNDSKTDGSLKPTSAERRLIKAANPEYGIQMAGSGTPYMVSFLSAQLVASPFRQLLSYLSPGARGPLVLWGWSAVCTLHRWRNSCREESSVLRTTPLGKRAKGTQLSSRPTLPIPPAGPGSLLSSQDPSPCGPKSCRL